MDSYHGDLVFDQDGLIEVTVNANRSVAIGSGLGGHLTIRRGMYKLNLMGQHAVGIGSNTGDIDPLIGNCFIGIKSVALSAVGIGSFMGRCDMMIEHSSVNMDFEGSEIVMLGSKHSEKLQISIYSATVIAQSKAHDITVNDTLSGGEMKRIEIAMAAARGGKMSLFDEPEAGIDLWSFQSLIEVFENLRNITNGNILIISHQERILEIADKIIYLKDGVIDRYDESAKIMDELNMRRRGGCDCAYGQKGVSCNG